MLLTFYIIIGIIALIALGSALRSISTAIACLFAPCRLAKWLCCPQETAVVCVNDGDFAEFV